MGNLAGFFSAILIDAGSPGGPSAPGYVRVETYDCVTATYNGRDVNKLIATECRLAAADLTITPSDATQLLKHAEDLEVGGDDMHPHGDAAGEAAQAAGLDTWKFLYSERNLQQNDWSTYHLYADNDYVADLIVASKHVLVMNEKMLGVKGRFLILASGETKQVKHGVGPGAPASMRLFWQFKARAMRAAAAAAAQLP